MSFTYQIAPGTTDVSVVLRALNVANGTPNTSFAYDSAGIDLQYTRLGSATVDITEATQTVNGAHSDGGVAHIGNGYFRLDLPDAACASGVSSVLVEGTASDIVIVGCLIQLEGAVNKIYSDTTVIASDVVLAEAALSDIESSLVIVKSDLVVLDDLSSDIHSSLVITKSDLVVLDDLASDIHSSLVIAKSDLVLLTAPGDGTAGAFPANGITDQGTAQAYTHGTPSLTLRAAAGFGDDALAGSVALIYGSTQGYWQAAKIASNVGSTDVATLEAALEVEATGTISYKIFAVPPGSSVLTTAQDSKLTKIASDVVVLDAAVSDVESSLVIIKSDLIVVDDLASDIHSSLVVVKSDLVISNSDTTAIETAVATAAGNISDIESSLVIVKSDLVVITSDIGDIVVGEGGLTSDQDSKLTRIASDIIALDGPISDIESSLVIIKSDLVVHESMISDVESSLVVVKSDLVISNSDTTAIETAATTAAGNISDIESSLVIVKSDLVVITSDSAEIVVGDGGLTPTQESQLARIQSDVILLDAAVSDVESSLVIVKSDLVEIRSDTTHIESDTVAAEASLSDIESTLVIVKSDLVIHEAMISDVESSLVIVKSDLVISNSDTTAIQTKTDSLTFSQAGHVDANVQRINDVAITGDGSAGDKFDVV